MGIIKQTGGMEKKETCGEYCLPLFNQLHSLVEMVRSSEANLVAGTRILLISASFDRTGKMMPIKITESRQRLRLDPLNQTKVD